MEYVPNEKATPIRYPSTANLMVDSKDRGATYPLCNDFLITKNQSLMNGFFTRVGTTEVVFEWTTPNVLPRQYQFLALSDVDPTPPPSGITAYLRSGFYNQQEFLQEFVAELNDAAIGVTFTVTAVVGGEATIEYALTTATSFTLSGNLIEKVFGQSPVTDASLLWQDETFFVPFIDLRPTRYIDMVCTQLTNNQAVKDASTAQNTRDVLCRWYFDFDNATPVDDFGYPILMGYSPFFIRRIYNPPKQIQWQSNVPIGQMAFQLYNDRGTLQSVFANTNFLMTLQASET